EHGTAAGLFGIAYGNGNFVAVGYGGGATSVDGSSWTPILTSSNRLRAITFGNGVFAAVGKAGEISSSSDTTVWTARRQGETQNLHGIACGRGLSVAVGNAGMILTSSNGVIWN